jgi:prevent-host-death family protein
VRDVTTAEARRNLADLLNRVAYTQEHVVVKRRGREIAAIVPMEDLGLLTRLRELLARRDVSEALDELERGASIPWTELKKELEG